MPKRRSKATRPAEARPEARVIDSVAGELLDHVAEELAKEYLRLVKQVASDPRERED